MSSQKLERVLLESGTLDPEQLAKAKAHARSRGMALERSVVALGLATEDRTYRDVSKAYNMPFGDPAKAKQEAIDSIPKEQIEQNNALPMLVKGGVLYVAIDDPIKTFVADFSRPFVGWWRVPISRWRQGVWRCGCTSGRWTGRGWP